MIQILKYGEVKNEEIFSRGATQTNIAQIVQDILNEVKNKGDEALYDFTERFDHVKLNCLKVSQEEMHEAEKIVGDEFINILEKAATNIRNFHAHQVRNSFIINDEEGKILGQKIMPIENVGLYIPGGTASYPSSVLMNAIPAQIAGCPHIFMTTPPNKQGKINPYILVAAKIAKVQDIYKIGGAQAIGAFAYGTQSVPKVDKIVGPGNAFVAEAKRQVFGLVSIDMIAGPSEILIIADANNDPIHIAADLLSQAEHDKLASAVLVTNDETFANKVAKEIEEQLKNLPREEIARQSIENNGKIIITPDLQTAVQISNQIAPEHLEICLDNPFDYLSSISHAGSVFLGKNCPEALGDYFSGTNHTLPTSGTARFSSPLSVDDFVKKIQYSYYTKDALEKVYQDVAKFASCEGLDAHAKSIKSRFEDIK